ncbi:formimidoylglutamase [Muribacter muris]|uniref:Formimidoylglutamase n=1 Tax=Muribacter muris TaxID=67855 RepID=A0A4Y9K205_9PAST|nr:formimidoylglutamase [Muribacter muris]MBF0784745.1 formimidoylglutamase [Muribacter muris]MBF0827808.1 formimidoylglutamase [Muribacter muris]TFV11169.1 formimidoylglutamase [Muribacter muris]
MSVKYTAFEQAVYTGRQEPYENTLAQYWYQHIHTFEQQPIALLGFACDQGVNRNQGRIGAKYAPRIIKSALAKLPISWALQQRYAEQLSALVGDAGEIHCQDEDRIIPELLEQAQHQYADSIAAIVAQNRLAIGIGGGHEIAWGSFLGLHQGLSAQHSALNIGVINLDAHLDLRQDQYATSGTPFRQIAEYLATSGQLLAYFCIGVSEFANTAALFERAKALKVKMLSDNDCYRLTWQVIESQILAFIAPLDRLYLTIDLDCLNAGTMPAVSAVAAKGLPLDFVERCISTIIQSGKVSVIDIAEYNPHYDIDGRGAKVAARLLALISEQQLLNGE